MLRRNGPVVKSVESVLRLEGSLWWERLVKEIGLEPGVKERGSYGLDSESGKLNEWVDVVYRSRWETEGLEWGWRRELGSWFQRHGEAYRKERSVIRITRMMLVVERGWRQMKSECCEEVEQRWVYVHMELGWSWELFKWVRGVCIQWVRLFWASEEMGVMWQDLGALTTARAEVWICWRRAIWD